MGQNYRFSVINKNLGLKAKKNESKPENMKEV